MVARRQKLFAAGTVILAGLALAWPLRRIEPLPPGRAPVALASPGADRAPEAGVAAMTASHAVAPTDPAPLSPHSPPPDRDPFAGVPAPALAEAASPAIFSTVSNEAPAAALPPGPPPPVHEIHVVHEGDSLDRLARRYLGDETRALEIFDLNRDVLDNPHVLRIGVELRLPASGPAGVR